MDKDYWNEQWKDLQIETKAGPGSYLLSTYGRIKSFVLNPMEGSIIKTSLIGGYHCINLRQKGRKTIGRYIHRLVAMHFTPTENPAHLFVIHLDYNKDNNHISNLKWATKEEKEAHQQKNPNWVRTKGRIVNSKLNEAKVKLIKRKLQDPQRRTRMKILARQFGISEMQLYRIKSGENWGHVTVD